MRPAFLLLALVMLVIGAGPAVAQTTDEGPAAAAQSATEATTEMEAAPAAGTGLPMRATQPRTMRAYWHVFLAFAATWLLLFGYALTMGRRFGRLEDEVRQLRESA